MNKRKHPSDKYLCRPNGINGSAFLYAGDNYSTLAPNGDRHVGFVVSIYGGFAPNPWQELHRGFHTKKELAKFCHENGFAIYWRASNV